MDNTVSTSQIGNIASNITRDAGNKFNSGASNPAQTVSLASMMPKPGKAPQSFTESSYDRPDALYQTLNDGTKVAKYKNFLPGTNNEERLAQGQSTGEKWLHGAEKTFFKTANVVLGNTAGFVYGIGKAMTDGSMASLYDNEFVKTVDDWNTKLDYKLPNYYTQREKDSNLGSKLGSANFWANDIMAGSAFTLGTVASEAIWAYATGGASLALRGAKIGAGIGVGARVAEGVGTAARVGEEAASFGKTLSSLERIKRFVKSPLKNAASKGFVNREGAILGGKIGDRLNTLRFATTSSGAEAQTETWHYMKEARENYLRNFSSMNEGREPSAEELVAFEGNLSNAANAVFAANVAIVGGANVLFLGGSFNIKNPFKSLSNTVDKKFFGVGVNMVEKEGKMVAEAIKATKGQKITGAVFGTTKNLFNEAILEEGLQGVTTATANKYIESTYNPKYTRQNFDLMGAVYESMSHQYGSKEGWNEIGTAAIMTLFGGAATGNLLGETTTELKNRRADMEYQASGINNFSAETVVGNIMRDRVKMANQMQGAQERQEEAQDKGDLVGSEIARNDSLFSRIHFNHNIKREVSEDLSDLKIGLDLMTEEQFKEQGISAENIDAFKEQTLTEYKTVSESYAKNREFAEAMTGGNNQLVGNKKGSDKNIDKRLLVEALTYNLTMGEVTGGLQNDLLSSIKKEVLGSFSNSQFEAHLDINNILQNASKKTTSAYYASNKEIAQTEKEKTALEKELVQLERNKNTKEDNTVYNNRYANISGRLIELNNKSAELKQKRDALLQTAKVENPFIKDDVYVSGADLDQTESQLKELSELISNLQETNPVAHAKITKLTSEYNKSVRQFKEFNNAAKTLADKNYNPKVETSFLSKMLNSNKSLDEFTNDFFTQTIADYTAVRATEVMGGRAEEILSDVSEEDYKEFKDNGNISAELLETLAKKEKSGEKLLPKEEEIYKAKKAEVVEAAKLIADVIEVSPQEALDAKVAELEKERDAKIAEVEKNRPKEEISIVSLEDLDNLTEEQKVKLKQDAKEQIEKLPDDVFFLTHLTQTVGNLNGILKNGLNTGVAIESTTNVSSSKAALLGAIEAIIDGKVRHANAANLVIVAFPNSLVSPGAKKSDYTEAVSNFIAENHTEDFGTRIPAQYNVASFTGGKVLIGANEVKAVKGQEDTSAKDISKIKEEYETKINAIKNGGLSDIEMLEKRIKTAIEENKLSMTYVGETYDDIVNKEPTSEEMAEYAEYLEKIQNSKRKDKNFAVRVNPNTSTGTKAEIGLTKEELIKFQDLNFKLAQWRMLDGAVTGESESIADLIELLNQLKTVLAAKEVKSDLSKQELIDVLETEEMRTSKDSTQNSFTQVHDVVTAKIVTENGERVVRFSDLNIDTIIGSLGETPTMVDPDGVSGRATVALLDKFRKKEGTKFIFEGATFTVGIKGRLSVKESEFEAIKEKLDLTPLSTNLNHSTYSPVYQENTGGEGLTQVKSDFIHQSTNQNVTMPYNPDALYDTKEGEIVRFQVRLDDTYNAKLMAEYEASGKTKKDKKYLRDNLVIYTIKDGSGEVTGSLKATNSSVKESDANFLKIREKAFQEVTKKGNVNMSITIPVTVKAKKVILGIPNMTVAQTGEGYEPLNKDFDQDSVKMVTNTGYVLNGKSTLSKDGKGVRFDFVTKLSKDNPTKKIPIVVFEYRGQLVAFPVSLITTAAPKGEEVGAILENKNNLSEVEQVKAINRKLIENGIEPSQFGLTSLDEGKLTAITAAMDALEDFVNVEDLAKKEYEAESLIEQAQIAIDLKNRPIGAPKLVLDLASYSGEAFEEPTLTEEQEAEAEAIDSEITKKVNILTAEIVKAKSQLEKIDIKIFKVEAVYESQKAALKKTSAKPGAYISIDTTRAKALGKLDAEAGILEDRISDLETEIEGLEESAYGAILTIPADGIEEVSDAFVDC